MEPRLRALIFDYDGLIVDSERAMADVVIEVVAEWGGTVGYEDFGHLFGTTEADDVWEELLPRWCGRPATLAELEARLIAEIPARVEHLRPLPGVVALLDAAHAAGIKTGLGTGAERDRLEPRLARNSLLDRFDAIVTRAEVERGKPAPDIFLAVADRLGVDPVECLVLEDSPPGCEAALAAGMRVIACPSAVSAHCAFPDGVTRVTSLLEVSL